MSTDYRALCAVLTAALNDWQWETGDDRYAALIARARAALAQSEPVAPTDEEIMELMPQQMRDDLATAPAPSWTPIGRRSMRRPKPPSLKEQALAALEDDDIDVFANGGTARYLIRRALEALDD